VRTELINTSQSPRDNVCPFQVANILSILLRRGCKSVLKKGGWFEGETEVGGRKTPYFAMEQIGNMRYVQCRGST